jgi:hypothetical protein
VHTYCLSNHFHLKRGGPEYRAILVLTASPRCFSGRSKALPVDNSGTGYLKGVCDYVHLNPASEAGLLERTIPQGTAGADQSWAGKLRRGNPLIGGVESLKRIEIELKGA